MIACIEIEIENGSCDLDHASFRFAIHRLRFDTFYLCAKFDDSSSHRSRDITGPKI